MNASRITALALLSLLVAAATLACPAEEPQCAADADCGAGFRCTEGSCQRVAVPGGGGAGGGGGIAADECDASDDCLTEPFRLLPDLYWDGSEAGDAVCSVPLRACPTGECPVATVCGAVPDDATTPGLVRCELDSDCWSGRCLERDGVRFCLRACANDADCPYTEKTEGAPAGFTCQALVDRGVPLQSCVPVDPAAPGRTLCRDDCDCGPPGDCAPDAGLACRFVGKILPRLRAVPVCEPLPAAPERESGVRCRGDALSCHGGGCGTECEGTRTPIVFCGEWRCSEPCVRDASCPDRLTCMDGEVDERIGTWRAVGADDEHTEGRIVHYCRLPRNGCLDEQDCCPTLDANGACLGGWGPTRQRCSVATAGSPTSPRLLTLCADIDARLGAPGSCCDSHDACDSALCVPARAGTACAGGGVCSVPCEPDPEAGTGADTTPAKDLCAAADFGGNLYHQGSRCLPFDFELPIVDAAGTPGTRLVPLRVCR